MQNLADRVVWVQIFAGKVLFDFIWLLGLLLFQYNTRLLLEFSPSAPAHLFHKRAAATFLIKPLISGLLSLRNAFLLYLLISKAFENIPKTSSHSVYDFILLFLVIVFIAGLRDICRIFYRSSTAVIKTELFLELLGELAFIVDTLLIRTKACIFAPLSCLEIPHQLWDITRCIRQVWVICSRLLSAEQFGGV